MRSMITESFPKLFLKLMDPFCGHVRGSEDRVSLGYVGDPVCRDAQVETISHFLVAGSCKVVFWSWLFLSVHTDR